MPHFFANRPRLHDVVAKDPSLSDHFRWETINAITYQVGGVFFIIGSICFFPELPGDADIGARIFIIGSVLFLLVTSHDMAEVVRHYRTCAGRHMAWVHLEFWAAAAYIAGTLLFVVGSLFLQPEIDLPIRAAWCHVVGSLFFVVGATINVLEIVAASDRLTLQLMNLTALTFVTGSLLFTLASIPYLWRFASLSTRDTMDAFLAAQYLIGSFLFFLGGLFNYVRAYTVLKREIAKRAVAVASTESPASAPAAATSGGKCPALEDI